MSALRRGVRVSYLFTRAFFIVSLAAAMASFFLGAYYQIGDPTGGKSFTLTSIAAAVLGGASLLGGRGSFVGAVVGALFLNMIITVLPYLGWTRRTADHGGRVHAAGADLLPGAGTDRSNAQDDRQPPRNSHTPSRSPAVELAEHPAVTPLDRLLALRAITDLLGRYCIAFDDQDWDTLATLWAEDCAFLVDGTGPVGRQAVL